MLTGKCKGQFEKYLIEKEIFEKPNDFLKLSKGYNILDSDYLVTYEDLPYSMIFGLIQQFSDTTDILVNTKRRYVEDDRESFFAHVETSEKCYRSIYPKREKAQIAAIEKFNELYNSKHKES